MNKFTPDTFVPPVRLETELLILRMLTIHDLVKDYDAVMTCREEIRGVFGPNDTWPEDDLTLEQDLIDLGWHQKEFQNRSSFAYTVMSPDETICLGCVYIMPSSNPNYDARIILWSRKSQEHQGLDEYLFDKVRNWIEDEWPFKNAAYPGRSLSWEDYYS
ncbi:MAG: hypothetical protein K9I69_04765 [Ignavibacteriales bacterium]|nr:hypothetical protein [Ignavibacteriales bacterium]MCF8306440.1 hypothetical protein [Ignavibacteriales bacterium]MCF8435705.1 hypothetical protein [Ignavibacteriales bacterium]